MFFLLFDRFLPFVRLFPKNRFQKRSVKYLNQRKLFRRKLNKNDFEISKPLLTCSELFDSILRDKFPAYKKDSEDFLIISETNDTMRHPIFDVNIRAYVSEVLSSDQNAGARLKPLFAVVTGMGRGKTRMLVEMQRKFNEFPKVFCLALTFNRHVLKKIKKISCLKNTYILYHIIKTFFSNWSKILKLPDSRNYLDPVEIQYAVNVVARIISMNYHISLDDTADLLLNVIGKFKIKSSTPSDLIHECVKYIIAQYRANGHEIDQFVLEVDESVVIQESLDPEGKLDIHRTLRECLLTRPMNMDDNLHLKVDLVMSG